MVAVNISAFARCELSWPAVLVSTSMRSSCVQTLADTWRAACLKRGPCSGPPSGLLGLDLSRLVRLPLLPIDVIGSNAAINHHEDDVLCHLYP